MTGAAKASQPPDEHMLLLRRREKAGWTPEEARAAGVTALALSGGGIRSATFCLGLVRALAANQVLRRFDYLSTVSGGGYAGSAISRLYADRQDAKVVEDALARDDNVFLWWVRSNGRYLTPAGLADLGLAVASIARGVLSTHFEVGMLLFLAAAAMLAPYVAVPWLRAAGWLPAWSLSWRESAGSFWWWAAAVPFFLAAHHIFAYWFRRSTPQAGSTVVDALAAIGGLAIALLWGRSALAQLAAGPPFLPSVLSGLGCLVLLSLTSAFASRAWTHRLSVSQVRLKHTKGLARAGWGMLGLGLLGALDWGTWKLSQAVLSPSSAALALPSLAVVIGAVRLLLSRIGNLRTWLKAQVRAIGRTQLVNALGVLLLLAVVVIWATAFQWLLQAAQGWDWWLRWLAGPPIEVQATSWLVLLLLPLAYVWLTRRNLELLNLSSLHNFYRARIERAYVSTGNPKRFKAGILAPRALVDTTIPEMRLAEAIDGDDVELARHRPHDFGGPIHLLNCCINQTVDDRTGTYNADRKGVCVTVSALGAETGTHAADGDAVPGTLSMWAAISGAAASSGMGSRTSPGLAALLFLSGLRLGYWLHALGDRGGKGDTPIGRPRLVLAEALARFPGLQSPQWYLSDGGHFDNTGVYPLLKRKAALIVLADCGADPDYRFEDLQNLVRKAEIDYGAFIEFIRPPVFGDDEEEGSDDGLRLMVARPADFTRVGGSEFLLLGRCRYADGSTGALVVVKPRLVPGLPLDIAGYSQQDALFPQQGTGDQFFDEAQWEAYHQLAWHLGRTLTHANLQRLQRWALAG